MVLRAAVLETLLTVNLDDVAKAEKTFKQTGERIEKKPIQGKVDADTKPFATAMGKVEQETKRLVSRETALTVNANIARAEKSFDRAQQRLDYLRSVETTMDVSADIKRAEANLQRIERSRDGLVKARSEMVVEVDGGKARKELQDVADFAETQAKDGGKRAGSGLVASMDSATRGAGEKVGQAVGDGVGSTLEDALAAIPVAGGVILAAVAIGKAIAGAIQNGLQVEVKRDRLQALTGISEEDAARFARAAGEAYANVFGESIEANMDTARLALQFDLLDADATTSAAQRTISGLAGLADVLEEDVRPIAQAVSVLLSTGVVRSAEEAYDLIATGAREGVNRNEDLVDTLTEYPALFQRLGLSGQQGLGLVAQAMRAGARNSDLAADALKEFQIRATDASDASAEGFRLLGLNAQEMTDRIARGGPDAVEGLDMVLDRLREMEDPVARNAAAVALFGTQAEDLGDALFAMDLSTAVEQLNGVEGAAQRMFDTLSSNDATALTQAQRNVEVAVQGMQGALAVAFSDPLQEAADWISENRGPMLQFFSDLVNGAFDFGVGLVESTASGTEAFGEFVSGPLRDTAIMLRDIIEALPGDTDLSGLDATIASMGNFDDTTDEAASTIRDIIPELESMRDEFNHFFDPEIAAGYLNDATLRLATSIDAVGYAADGVTPLVNAYTVAQDGSVVASSELEQQIRNAVDAMGAEVDAAAAAGEGQDALATRYGESREALLLQLEAMGLTREEAVALTDAVLATPGAAVTTYSSNAAAEQAGVDALANTILTLPDGSVVVTANTEPAESAIAAAIIRMQAQAIALQATAAVRTITTAAGGNADAMSFNARGNLLEFYARGGFHGLTPMAPLAQMVPANTWRVVGDRSDVTELYAPLDGSPRSWALLMEGLRRMPGVMPMADGGVVASGPMRSQGASVTVPMTVVESPDLDELAAKAESAAGKAVRKLRRR